MIFIVYYEIQYYSFNNYHDSTQNITSVISIVHGVGYNYDSIMADLVACIDSSYL